MISLNIFAESVKNTDFLRFCYPYIGNCGDAEKTPEVEKQWKDVMEKEDRCYQCIDYKLHDPPETLHEVVWYLCSSCNHLICSDCGYIIPPNVELVNNILKQFKDIDYYVMSYGEYKQIEKMENILITTAIPDADLEEDYYDEFPEIVLKIFGENVYCFDCAYKLTKNN